MVCKRLYTAVSSGYLRSCSLQWSQIRRYARKAYCRSQEPVWPVFTVRLRITHCMALYLQRTSSSPCPGTMSRRSWSWRAWFFFRKEEILRLITTRRNFSAAHVSLRFCFGVQTSNGAISLRGKDSFHSESSSRQKTCRSLFEHKNLYAFHWTSLKVKKSYQNRSCDPETPDISVTGSTGMIIRLGRWASTALL